MNEKLLDDRIDVLARGFRPGAKAQRIKLEGKEFV